MSDAAPPGTTLRNGRYVVVGVLGYGSQGETLDAVDKRDGRAVAIKRFQVRGAKGWKDVELAEREARVLSTLSHPNLPVYIEHFEEQGALFLVMQKIEGETLASLRRRKATLSSADLARFLTDASDALAYLHSRVPPIIHRDIKPGNVIRRADGSFAFVDFGSVRDQLKPEGGSTVVGTFGYMAPEQFQGRALPGSDVYAVGATALSLLAGCEPEDLPHRGLGIDVAAAVREAGAEPWLVRALTAMLEPNPNQRPSRIPLRAPGASRRADARASNPPSGRAGEREQPFAATAGDWRALRERAREERRRIREQSRRLRDELKDQVKRETRRASAEFRNNRSSRRRRRRERSHGHAWPVAPLLMLVLFLGLTAARIAAHALFVILLPTLLFALSAFFGQGLRRAAWRVRELGFEVDLALRHALQALRARVLGLDLDARPEPAQEAPESVVEPEPELEPEVRHPPRQRVEVEARRAAEEPDSAEAEERAEPQADRARR